MNTVPPALISTCFLTMMVLGTGIVCAAVRHPPGDGPSEMKIWGSKFELKGPAWLIMIALGAIIAATPVLVGLFQYQSQAPFKTPAPAQVVSEIREPSYSDFTFLRDVSYLDLRSSQDEPWYTKLPGWARVAGPHARIRPATLMNYMVIRKIGDADEIRIDYATSGALDLRCLTHRYTVRTSTKNDQQVGEITADLRNIPTGTEFTLIVEATYWNAFRGATGDDFTTYTHDQRTPEEVTIVAVFPEAKPFGEVKLLAKRGTDKEMNGLTAASSAVADPSRRSYFWSTTNDTPGEWFYTLKWSW